MAKKSIKKSMYPFVAVICAAIIIVSVFLTFMTAKSEVAILGDATTNYTGLDFIKGLFANEDSENLSDNVKLLVGLKGNEDAGTATTVIMLAELLGLVLGCAIAVLGLFGILQPRRKDMVSLAKGLCFLAAVAGLVALFVGIGLGKGLAEAGSASIFGVSLVKSTYSIAIGGILFVVGGVGGVVGSLFVK